LKLFELGTKIKNLRKDKQLTQLQLAQVAGISRVTLGKLERGEVVSVSIRTLDLILDALGWEIDFKTKNTSNYGLADLDSIKKSRGS